MTKTKYDIGDPVWIHGITTDNKLIKGQVVHMVDLSSVGHPDGPHYIIAISTGIEDLLEIRTWETMSENPTGPIGVFRELTDAPAIHKRLKQTGYTYVDEEMLIDEPTPEQIHAAIERTSNARSYDNSIASMKDDKPKRKFYNKKRKI